MANCTGPSHRNWRVTTVLAIVCLTLTQVVKCRSTSSLDCNPSQVKMTCLLGCFGCFEAFGVELYDMAACCRSCRLTNADIVDDGPSRCSRAYIRTSWLKRIG